MAIPANGAYTGVIAPTIHGMIDARAYISSPATWPTPVQYLRIERAANNKVEIHLTGRDALESVDGKNLRMLATAKIADFLVGQNSRMYNGLFLCGGQRKER